MNLNRKILSALIAVAVMGIAFYATVRIRVALFNRDDREWAEGTSDIQGDFGNALDVSAVNSNPERENGQSLSGSSLASNVSQLRLLSREEAHAAIPAIAEMIAKLPIDQIVSILSLTATRRDRDQLWLCTIRFLSSADPNAAFALLGEKDFVPLYGADIFDQHALGLIVSSGGPDFVEKAMARGYPIKRILDGLRSEGKVIGIEFLESRLRVGPVHDCWEISAWMQIADDTKTAAAIFLKLTGPESAHKEAITMDGVIRIAKAGQAAGIDSETLALWPLLTDPLVQSKLDTGAIWGSIGEAMHDPDQLAALLQESRGAPGVAEHERLLRYVAERKALADDSGEAAIQWLANYDNQGGDIGTAVDGVASVLRRHFEDGTMLVNVLNSEHPDAGLLDEVISRTPIPSKLPETNLAELRELLTRNSEIVAGLKSTNAGMNFLNELFE